MRKICTGTFLPVPMLLTLKVFCMAKSAVDLDVNIALSNYGFNGVASFEIVRFGLQKRYF